jgi:hypothetical protein
VIREWALFHGSRACPACLTESGGAWSLWWKLGAAAVCPRHRLLLVDTCPGCGIRLRRGYASQPRGMSRVAALDPALCGNNRPGRGGLCRVRLADLPVVAVGAELSDAQEQVLAVGFGGPGRIGGQPVASSDWFASLRYLAGLVRYAGDPDHVAAAVHDLAPAVSAFDADRRQRLLVMTGTPAALSRMPQTAALAAALLATVSPMMAAEDMDEAAARLAPLAEAAGRYRRRAGHDPLRNLTPPEPLAALLHMTTPPVHRVIGAMSRSRTPQPPVSWQLRHLPQLLDADDYAALVAGYLPHTEAPVGRRIAALALARLAGADTWPAAVAALDMAARWARLDSHLVRRITDAAGFWAAVRAAGARLATRGLVDYAARRQALSGLMQVPLPVLAAACQPLGERITPARCRHAAAWIWERYTGGDVREAPALVAAGALTATIADREVHRRFRRWLPAPLAEALRSWACDYLAARGAA